MALQAIASVKTILYQCKNGTRTCKQYKARGHVQLIGDFNAVERRYRITVYRDIFNGRAM